MQVRNYLRQMELLYQDCEEEEFMKHIVQVLPTVVEMLDLKWSILNYQKRTKQYLATRLGGLQSIGHQCVERGNISLL